MKNGVWCAAVGALLVVVGPVPAVAQEPRPEDEPDQELDPKTLARYHRLAQRPRGYARLFGLATVGRGLRFNNPYRLQTQLGETAESLSLTATYLDLGAGALFGEADDVQHGFVLHLSVALEGLAQQALSASYQLTYRDDDLPIMAFGRLGPSFLLNPDPNVGAELAGGFAAFFTGSWGVVAELVGNLFWGAGTHASSTTVYPILSLQLGLIADIEVLP